MKKFFVLALVLVMTMTAVLAIPVSASYVNSSFARPNCGCSGHFYSEYTGGVYASDSQVANAWAYVEHQCDSAYAYVSMQCWIAPWSNMSRYTYRNFTHSGRDNGLLYDNGEYPGEATASLVISYNNTDYCLLAVENHYKVSVKHNGVEYVCQAFSSDGDAPTSYTPPVVTE